MKILLQCIRTHNYVQDVVSWTTLPEHALEFTAVVPALDFAVRHGLKDIRPVIHWDDSPAEVHAPAH